MEKKKLFDDLQSTVSQLLENSLAKDIEKNVRAVMTQAFAKLDLVTQEEFNLHAIQIAQLQEKLDALEKRTIILEAAQVFSENKPLSN